MTFLTKFREVSFFHSENRAFWNFPNHSEMFGGTLTKKLKNALHSKDYTELNLSSNFSAQSFSLHSEFQYGFSCSPSTIAVDPVQSLLAVGLQDGSVRIFGQPGVERVFYSSSKSPPKFLRFSCVPKASTLVVSVDNRDKILVFDLEECCLLWTVTKNALKLRNTDEITQVLLLPESHILFLGTSLGYILSFDVFKNTLCDYVINPLSEHPVVAVLGHPEDANHLLIGYQNGLLVVWDFKAEKPVKTFGTLNGEVLTSASWHPDKRHVVCGYEDGRIMVWDLDNKNTSCILTLSSDPVPVRKVKWSVNLISRESSIVVTGGTDKKDQQTGFSVVSLSQDFVRKTQTFEITDGQVISFEFMSNSPWGDCVTDPSAVIVVTDAAQIQAFPLNPSNPSSLPSVISLMSSPIVNARYFHPVASDVFAASTSEVVFFQIFFL
eukprot:Lithocolla_globosa_v1_NODE_595_length_3638_cov_5.396037.p1 type:complete len:437 gc:universal NODE_595_length_3638_cov_5.396037:1432-122(-)